MKSPRRFPIALIFLGCLACSRSHSQAQPQPHSVDLQLQVTTPYHAVVYGDSRFHDPKDTEAANPPVRQALVQAIAQTNPAFISFGGDIVYNGYDKDDWKIYDSETAVWREKKIPVYPALGNHDLQIDVDRGNLKVTMHRLDLTSGTPVWTTPDSVTIMQPTLRRRRVGTN